MKELNITQINAVSGAGIFGDAGAALGKGIGMIIDAHRGDTNHTAENAASDPGKKIGNIADGLLGTDCADKNPKPTPGLV